MRSARPQAAPVRAPQVSEPGEEAFIDCDAQRALDLGRPSYARSVSEVNADLRSLARAFPKHVRVEDIGDSGLERDILALRIGVPAPNGAKKPTLFILAGQHGREIATYAVAAKFAARLASGVAHDPRLARALELCDVVIVPASNPDGYSRVLDGYDEA